MVAALLGRELRARLAGDPIAEDGLLALELARLVVGVNPVGDLSLWRSNQNELNGQWARVDFLLP